MRATVLTDNIASGELSGEWGLSIYIEYEGKKILLDTGSTNLFLQNAEKLGIDLAETDCGVLSHAHYDHGDGMAAFFQTAKEAKFYLRDGCKENCFRKKKVFHKYIGLPKGILEQYRDGITYVQGDYELFPGVTLVPHKTAGLAEVGKQNSMYRRNGLRWIPDDFSHEQSLVFQTGDGLVIFNSCSHGGADNIIREVAETYPGQKIAALIGGFHLFRKPDGEVQDMARRIKATGVERIYTGHCTGQRGYDILKAEMGEQVQQLRVGLVIEL